MAKIVWNDTGKRFFENGVSNGVLYVQDETGAYPAGVPWNGLVSVSESPEGGEPSPFYADNQKYVELMSAEEFKASIEAYTYPKEFEACDGSVELAPGVTISGQGRSKFGICYRTEVGNDIDADLGYKLHLVYGCLASPSEKSYETENDSPELITFSWDVSTTPVEVTDNKPTASLVIDSRDVSAAAMTQLEDALYGTATGDPTLLSPAEVLAIVNV